MKILHVVLAVSFLCVTQLLAAEKLVLVAGGGTGGDGTVNEAKLNSPFGVQFDQQGTLYIVEMDGHTLRKLTLDGQLLTVAGTGVKGHTGDGGPATNAQLNGPHSLAIGRDGNIYLADTFNHVVRHYEPKTTVIKTVVGTGVAGFAGDGGPATKCQFNELYTALFNKTGDKLYLVDLQNRRIRCWDMKSDLVTTVAGNGQKGVPHDGELAVNAPLVDPRALALDSQDNLYILERSGHALRVVSPDGKIKTVAGTGKKGGVTADGPAMAATLSGPKFLWCAKDDTVLIADSDNHCIRRYLPKGGTLVRVVGTGKAGNGGLNGPPLEAQLNQPHGIYEAPDGTLYISDSSNNRVLKIVSE